MSLRASSVWIVAVAAACCSCSTTSKQIIPAETVVAMTEPGSPAADWAEHAITPVPIPSQELETRRTQAAKRFSGERVIFLRLRASDRSPLRGANVACPASRIGAIADEDGIAWLHGMNADTVEVRISALVNGTSVRTGFVAIVPAGDVVGFDIRAPKGVPVVAEP